jgi:hypothetical protein
MSSWRREWINRPTAATAAGSARFENRATLALSSDTSHLPLLHNIGATLKANISGEQRTLANIVRRCDRRTNTNNIL